MLDSQSKSNLLVCRIRQEADAKQAAGKSAMARKCRFVADSIERCFGADADVALEELDSEWLAAYREALLQDRKTENTVSNYLRVIRNICRMAVKEGLELNLAMFDNFHTGNSKSKKDILSIPQMHDLLNADLRAKGVFGRTRDVLALCFFGGGLRLQDVDSDNRGNRLCRLSLTEEACSVMDGYPKGNLLSFLGSDRQAAWARNLDGLAHQLNLPVQLTDDSAAEAWVEAARQLNVPSRVIGKVIGRQLANLTSTDGAEATDREVCDALRQVAASVEMNTMHWYAIRCHKMTPDETYDEIVEQMEGCGKLMHYIPFVPNKRKREEQKHDLFMKSLLFVKCSENDIVTIKRVMTTQLYIFQNSCAETKKAAPIFDAEMRTFMYLSGVKPESIVYYFPDELKSMPSFDKYEEVEIVEGPFAGKTATVFKKTANELSVLVKFTTINMYYTVEVPYRFLVPKGRNSITNKKG